MLCGRLAPASWEREAEPLSIRSQAGAWERGSWNYAYALNVKTGFNRATTPTISASTCASITGWIGL